MAEEAAATEEEDELLQELQEFASESEAEDEEPEEESDGDNIASQLEALRIELDALRPDAEAARAFRSDPVAGLNDLARQLGYQVAPQTPTAAAPAASVPMPGVHEAVEEAFADTPDLGFLKPNFEKALSKALGSVVKPMEEATQKEKARHRQSAIQSVESQMDKEFPGWRSHNQEMLKVGEFIRNALSGEGDLEHPEYGNIYKLVYDFVTKNGQSTAAAARRLSGAARNRTRTGNTGASRPDIGKRIKEAPSPQSQVEIALDAALAELGLG